MSDPNKLTLTLEQSLKLANREDAERSLRVIGALSAARILIGDDEIDDPELRRVVIELVASIADTV